ncbi:MAG: hypothetical protein ACLVB1_04910 [Blautia obeum]
MHRGHRKLVEKIGAEDMEPQAVVCL